MSARNHHNVLDLVDARELVSLAQEMVRIPSISGDEAKIASFVARKMGMYGLEVSVDEVFPGRPNVYGTLPGKAGKPTLIYNGHMDVVPPGEGWRDDAYSGTLRAGRVYGRGSADMKGGLASMMVAAKVLRDTGAVLKGNLVVSAVVAEEETGMGTRHMTRGAIRGDFAIVGEPTRLNVCIAHKGDVSYQITTIGKAAHASVAHEGLNAIYKMSKVIDSLQKLNEQLEERKKHPLLGSATLSVGTIEGGTISAAVPAFCKIGVDRRLLPGENAETGKAELESLIISLRREDPDLIATVKTIVEVPGLETSRDSMIVRGLNRAVLEIVGREPEVKGAPYTSDGGILGQTGTMTVIFGPGDITQAHQPDEWISVDEMVSAAKIYALTALRLLS